MCLLRSDYKQIDREKDPTLVKWSHIVNGTSNILWSGKLARGRRETPLLCTPVEFWLKYFSYVRTTAALNNTRQLWHVCTARITIWLKLVCWLQLQSNGFLMYDPSAMLSFWVQCMSFPFVSRASTITTFGVIENTCANWLRMVRCEWNTVLWLIEIWLRRVLDAQQVQLLWRCTAEMKQISISHAGRISSVLCSIIYYLVVWIVPHTR